jgi:hypothetical protein
MHANKADRCDKKDCSKKKDHCNRQGQNMPEKGAAVE